MGLDIKDEHEAVLANIELAWPSVEIGIAISEEDAIAAKAHNWRIYNVERSLEQPEKLVSLLKRQARA